jgi:hypothetical protein
MVAELSARHALPKQIVDGVTERTGGVPLFIEEVTRLLLERGEQSGTQAIPPTLQQSLMARLDRLGPAREVAQIAAAVGRDFSYDLLRRLERRATTKNNENQSVCDRFSIVYLLYWNFLPRLGKLLNTRWNFELGDGDARFWSAHGTSTNPFEERRSTHAAVRSTSETERYRQLAKFVQDEVVLQAISRLIKDTGSVGEWIRVCEIYAPVIALEASLCHHIQPPGDHEGLW